MAVAAERLAKSMNPARSASKSLKVVLSVHCSKSRVFPGSASGFVKIESYYIVHVIGQWLIR